MNSPRKRIIDESFDNDHEEDDDEDDESLELETEVNHDEDESPWLNSLIRQELDSAPVLGSRSKPPKKQANTKHWGTLKSTLELSMDFSSCFLNTE